MGDKKALDRNSRRLDKAKAEKVEKHYEGAEVVAEEKGTYYAEDKVKKVGSSTKKRKSLRKAFLKYNTREISTQTLPIRVYHNLTILSIGKIRSATPTTSLP